MDQKNFFESRSTYYLHRAEYLVALLLALYLLLTHFREVNWWHFTLLFVYIDLIGYLPGAIAYRRSKDRNISRIYYVMYNCMHSLISAALVALAWSLIMGPEWALLALPIHLCGDRALFGNFLKPFALSFEPEEHPAFSRLKHNLDYR